MIYSGNSLLVKQWIHSRFPNNKNVLPYETFCIVENDEIIAGVWIENYTGKSAVIHVSGDSGWCNRRFVHIVFNYCFNELKLYKLIATVCSTNSRASKFATRLGFVLECVIKDTEPDGDTIIHTMTKEQCKILRQYHGQKQLPNSN